MAMKETALVTGGARRIGRAIALRLAREGWRVAVHARAAARHEAEAVVAAILAAGGDAFLVQADLAATAELPRLVADAQARGCLRLLVNNASIFEADDARDFDLDRFNRHMAINLAAPLALVSAFAKSLPRGAEGAVVNVVDQRALRPNPLYFSYTLSKSALWSATRTMAQAYAPAIRVNAVGPGPVLPNEYEGLEGFHRETAGTLLGRPVELEDIAEAVVFLARAKSVTGQMIAVDSGQHLGWRTPDVQAP